MTSIRIVAASLFALGVAAALTACGAASSPAGSVSSSAASSSASPSSGSTASSRPTGTSTPEPIGGQCASSDLKGSIAPGGGGAAGSVGVTLVLTNTGSSPCSLQGWPGVSFVGDGNGTQLGAAAKFDHSAPHPSVTIAPGATATAPLLIGQALNYPSDECKPQKPDGFRVYPPGSKTALFVAYDQMTACTSDSVSLLTVGALVQG